VADFLSPIINLDEGLLVLEWTTGEFYLFSLGISSSFSIPGEEADLSVGFFVSFIAAPDVAVVVVVGTATSPSAPSFVSSFPFLRTAEFAITVSLSASTLSFAGSALFDVA